MNARVVEGDAHNCEIIKWCHHKVIEDRLFSENSETFVNSESWILDNFWRAFLIP